MPRPQVSPNELLETAVDALDRFGVTNDFDGEPLTETIDGVEREVTTAEITVVEDTSCVTATRTVEEDYLKVESITARVEVPLHVAEIYGGVKTVTVLEVRNGEITQFDSKEAGYALGELIAISQGETQTTRQEQLEEREKLQDLWDSLGNIFTKEQSLQPITSEEANPILDHMNDVLNSVSEIAGLDERKDYYRLPSDLLQDANKDLTALAERPGFSQLPPDTLQHFDELQNRSDELHHQVESTEEKWALAESVALKNIANEYVDFMSNPDLDDRDIQPFTLEEQDLILNLNPDEWASAVISARKDLALDPVKSEIEAIAPEPSQEMKELVANFVEKRNVASTLRVQADRLLGAAEQIENMAGEVYDQLFDLVSVVNDGTQLRELIDTAYIESDKQAVRDVLVASSKLLKTHKLCEIDLNGTQIVYDLKSQQLSIVDTPTASDITAQWTGKCWERISSTFTPAQAMALKEELEEQLDLDSFQLPAALDELTPEKVAGAQLSQ